MGRQRLTIQDMQETAGERGGYFRSKRYYGSGKKHLWECAKGHRWKAVPAQVRHGSWCPECKRIKMSKPVKYDVQYMNRFAQNKGGKCLSKKYVNPSTKLVWECSEGHRWEATFRSKTKGRWCPYCAGNIKSTIEEMDTIGKERSGRCLSRKYINDRTKLLWECAKGHQWEAIPTNVKRGSWCPVCAREK